MDKNWYESKTVQGAILFIGIVYLQKMGFVDSSILTEFIKSIGGLWGIYGARDAIK